MFLQLLTTALFTLIFTLSIFAQAPNVMDYTPDKFSLTADASVEVNITFDLPIDESSLDQNSVKIFGRWSGPADLNWLLVNGNVLKISANNPYFAGEWITVSLSKDVKGMNGTTLEKSFAFNFWIQSASGTLDLTEEEVTSVREPGEPHIQSYGGYGGDFNEDGYSDLAVPNELTNDVRMFLNDGAGHYNSFTIYDVPGGNFVSTNEGWDLNSNGHLDFAVGSGGTNLMSVFIGDGNGALDAGTSYFSGQSVRGLGIIDLNGDGHHDIVTANRIANSIAKFMNNGDGTFQAAVPQNITQANGETAIAIGDANNDGILDVFLGGYNSNDVMILLSDGEGNLTFSDEASVNGQPWQIAVGDMNGDGNLDVVSCNSFGNTNSVIFGDGAGGLGTAANYSSGSFPLAIDVGDIDGDGDLDLLSSNYNGGNWTLYENNGQGVMGNTRTFEATSAGSCAVIHDRDNDGDLDVSGIDEISDEVFYFMNDNTVGIQAISANSFRIYPNKPNPFSKSTEFVLEFDENLDASISIQNIVGQTVKVFHNGPIIAGEHSFIWDVENQQNAPSGIYLFVVKSDQAMISTKVQLIR